MGIEHLKTTNNSHVPYRYYLFSFIIYLISISKLTGCEQRNDLFRPVPLLQPYEEYYFDKNNENLLGTSDSSINQHEAIDSSRPTPPLDMAYLMSIKNKRHGSDNTKTSTLGQCNDCRQTDVSAHRVLKAEHFVYRPDDHLFSPIFNLNTLINNGPISEEYLVNNNVPSDSKPQNLIDVNSGIDLIEPGSGAGWDSNSFDDTTNVLEDTNTQSESVAPTPVLNPYFDQQSTPTLNDFNNYNRAPVLNRRLPKLAVTAGQVWRYFIPYDTFVDEDGDLRQLKSMIVPKGLLKHGQNDTGEQGNQYYSWLQYDPKYQLLYGFPTENDSGKHEIELIVSDQFGSISNETIEINVRQHQSTRAFTHLFVANHVVWDSQSFPSVVDAMGEFVKRISTKIYQDQPFKNFIVQYYNLNGQSPLAGNTLNQFNDGPTKLTTNSTNMSFNIAWSNDLIPIYPCNLTYLENMLKSLIDTQALEYDWAIEKSDKAQLVPSPNLIKALGPEFKLSSVSVHLQGSCEGKYLPQNSNVQAIDDIDTLPRVRIKIGKLNWKLGEPIDYQIPDETFVADKGNYTARNLQLSMHTIDGLTFDKDRKYNFLEFDSDSQTLYGLPYNQEDHSGQRELQLTAVHPKTGHKVREVFILNIEPQDLTTINNRAFKLSLYLIARTVMFGPRERVSLSHKVLGALRVGITSFRHERENPQLVVMDMQKFSIGSSLRDERGSLSFANYQDKITRVADGDYDRQEDTNTKKDVPLEEEAKAQSSVLYKFTWTNETIGYRGDCPVEVIKENILYALEQSMLEFKFPSDLLGDESEKNDSVRFHDRLRLYFEPESDLIHLRFEPLGACMSALELHDVGNGDFADQVDRAGDSILELNQEPQSIIDQPPPVIVQSSDSSTGNDEYWSIVLVLIIMVAVFIFVVVMLVLGLHTYKINQDKRFELQVRLAQARQNSMYLSSMILANQASPNDVCSQMMQPGMTKSMYVVQDEEKGSRKPVILDNEKQFLNRNLIGPVVDPRPTTVHLSGQTVHTTPMKSNMSFTLDSMASSNLQSRAIASNPYSSALMSNYLDDKQRSVTLYRRPSQSIQRFINQQSSMSNLNHSQSIITVASLASQVPMISQANLPVMYAQIPMFNEQSPHHNFASLQRRLSYQKHPRMLMSNSSAQTNPTNDPNNVTKTTQNGKADILKPNGANISLPPYNKMSSPSYSSSNSNTNTNQSVI